MTLIAEMRVSTPAFLVYKPSTCFLTGTSLASFRPIAPGKTDQQPLDSFRLHDLKSWRPHEVSPQEDGKMWRPHDYPHFLGEVQVCTEHEEKLCACVGSVCHNVCIYNVYAIFQVMLLQAINAVTCRFDIITALLQCHVPIYVFHSLSKCRFVLLGVEQIKHTGDCRV